MLFGAVALATLLWPAGADAQEWRKAGYVPREGRVRTDDGGWRAPTPADALRVLRDPGVRRPSRVAVAVLRQVHESRPSEELDALAGALAEMLEAGAAGEHYSEEYLVQREVLSALRAAAMTDPEIPGTPHDGSFDALVGVYETLAARALADGGTDPFEELYGDDGIRDYSFLGAVLRSIYAVRPATDGGDYLLALFEAADPPEPYSHNGKVPLVWCEAGSILRGPGRVRRLPDGRLEELPPAPGSGPPGRRSELPEIARNPRSFLARCNRVGSLVVVRTMALPDTSGAPPAPADGTGWRSSRPPPPSTRSP